jgi:hypothetical protein
MTITGGGNVGIGETAPAHKLSIKATDDTRGILVNNTLTTSYAEVALKASREFRIGTGGSASDTNARDRWYVYDATASTHRLTLDSSGNFGIGTTSPNNFTNQKSLTINGIPGGNSRLDFQINGTNEAEIVANDASLIMAHNDILKFYTAATERMRVKADGVVDFFGSIQSTGNQRFGVGPAHGNSSSPGITTKATTTSGVYWTGTGAGGWGGGNFTTNNSDRNMKTNIVPMDIDALQIIDSLETKYFNWTEKANKGDTSIRKAGIIAQDLRELMPEGVYGTEWDDDNENTNGLSLDENATTALLIKAIQELKAEIELLKSK